MRSLSILWVAIPISHFPFQPSTFNLLAIVAWKQVAIANSPPQYFTKNRRMRVAISGSRSISRLSESVKSRLDKIISLEVNIQIGDAPGVDALVMDYLAHKKYGKVTVWFIGREPRNCCDSSWTLQPVAGNYVGRDKVMHQKADYALAIWDGKSLGTKRNIEQMKDRVRVCIEQTSHD